ncbi:sugar ABC transporter permease [Pullulanibacillus camelliae]|uniref:Sugar ABC transporter permease n=1 Tax=Pullulanibacillus camelliae TaxID=1707096 RepID=A0A8J2VMN6_9BACL|nr:sugar ABC transporter permease [Pullulanibacillus camelliae]GGE33035.1 sugar ABC transporter permease [Pullulanibacillus camelliae]
MNVFGKKGFKKWMPLLGLLPAIIVFGAFKIYPSIMTFIYSFTQYSGIPGTPLHFVGLENYKMAFSGFSGIGKAIRITIIFALCVTLLQNALGLFAALVFNKKTRGTVFYRSLVFLPVVLSVVVTGLIWSLLFSPIGGPIEPIWKAVFGHSSSFFGSNTLALPLVIFVQIWQNAGFTMVVYLAGLQTVPTELLESAQLDGASRWQRFRHVLFPMIAASTTVNVLLCVIGALGTYDLIYVLTGGQFGTMTLGMDMFNTAFGGSNQLGYGSMIQMLQFALVLIVTLILQWYLRRREVEL